MKPHSTPVVESQLPDTVMKAASLKKWAWSYVAAILIIHGILFWNAHTLVRKGYPDFTIYYAAGTMVRTGMAHQLYDYDTQFQVQKAFAPGVVTRLFGPLPFNHPPIEAIFFAPLTFIPYPAAYIAWLFINLAMLATLPYLLRPHIPMLASLPTWAWFLLELAYFPVFMGLLQGQDSILLLFLYTLAFASLMQNRLVSSGAWLACGLFKFHLVLPFLVLLLLQQRSLASARKIFTGFLLVGTLLSLFSIAVVGPGQIVAYPRFVMRLEATMARGAIRPTDMANIRGALYVIAGGLPHIDAIALSLSAAVFVLAAWVLRQPSGRDEDLKLSLALLVTILVSYHALGYDLCILIPTALLLVQWLRGKPCNGKSVHIALGLAVLFFPPPQMILLIGHNQFGWLAWAVIAMTIGVAQSILAQNRHTDPSGKPHP